MSLEKKFGANLASEIERKYEVSEQETVPEVFSAAKLTLISKKTFRLSAIYFDTPEGDLAIAKSAVRRRVGGADAGWHIKIRGGEVSEEVTWPLSDEIPHGLSGFLREKFQVRAEDLQKTATIETERCERLLTGAGFCVQIMDDRVVGTAIAVGRKSSWREWETEVCEGGSPEILELIEPEILAAGAKKARRSSKIARTLLGEA